MTQFPNAWNYFQSRALPLVQRPKQEFPWMTNSMDSTMPPDERPDPPPMESELLDLRGEIADKLRKLYSEIEQEPIPDELLALLEKLDEAEAKSNR